MPLVNKIEMSPNYSQIVELYERLRNDLSFKDFRNGSKVLKILKEKFPDDLKDVFPATFYNWRRKYEKTKKMKQYEVAINKITSLATSTPINQIESLDVERVKKIIRKISAKILYDHLLELISNPEKLEQMNFKEKRQLYEMIRKEEDSERGLELKQKQDDRESAFTIFRLFAQYGNLKDNEIDLLKKMSLPYDSGLLQTSEDTQPPNSNQGEG